MTEPYEGKDPVAHVLSLNLHRRHLSESQRAMVAAKLATLKTGEKKSNAQICAPTQEEAAKQLQVSRRSVQAAKKVLKEARGYAAMFTTLAGACGAIEKYVSAAFGFTISR